MRKPALEQVALQQVANVRRAVLKGARDGTIVAFLLGHPSRQPRSPPPPGEPDSPSARTSALPQMTPSAPQSLICLACGRAPGKGRGGAAWAPCWHVDRRTCRHASAPRQASACCNCRYRRCRLSLVQCTSHALLGRAGRPPVCAPARDPTRQTRRTPPCPPPPPAAAR